MLRKYSFPAAALRRAWQLFVLSLLAIAVLPSAARAATLTSITVGPNVTLPVGLSRQVTATGNYSDGTMQDLTTQVTWASSAPSVATISNSSGSQGVATAVGLGVTTITATLGQRGRQRPIAGEDSEFVERQSYGYVDLPEREHTVLRSGNIFRWHDAIPDEFGHVDLVEYQCSDNCHQLCEPVGIGHGRFARNRDDYARKRDRLCRAQRST